MFKIYVILTKSMGYDGGTSVHADVLSFDTIEQANTAYDALCAYNS